MAAVTIHGDAVIGGLKTSIGSPSGGLVATWEAYPLPWPTDAKLPMCLFTLDTFRQSVRGAHTNQTYNCSVWYVANQEANTSQPVKYARLQAQEIADNLMNARTLGLGGNYFATVTGLSLDNPLTTFFAVENQRRVCYRIAVMVDVYSQFT